MHTLFKLQPFAILDEISAGGAGEIKDGISVIRDLLHHHKDPTDAIPPDGLVAWCGREQSKYELAASVITAVRGGESQGAAWTPAARALFEHAPEPAGVLDGMLVGFRPMSWSGSRATIMTARAELLLELKGGNRALAEHAEAQYAALQDEIERERKSETQQDRSRNERFE